MLTQLLQPTFRGPPPEWEADFLPLGAKVPRDGSPGQMGRKSAGGVKANVHDNTRFRVVARAVAKHKTGVLTMIKCACNRRVDDATAGINRNGHINKDNTRQLGEAKQAKQARTHSQCATMSS